MTYRLMFIVLFNVLAGNLACAQALQPGDHKMSLNVGGLERSYLLHIPPANSSKPMPIVMMLHGAGGTSSVASRKYGWIEKSDAEHFLAVFPQGLPANPARPAHLLINPNVWNDDRPPPVPRQMPDDVAFLGAVLDDVEHECNVDPKRIYITGFSNGASMTFYLATQLSSRIAAIAPVSGHCFFHDALLAHPIPLMLIVGGADPLNPLAGGVARNPWGAPTTKPAMIDSITDWLRFDGESGAVSTTQTREDVTTETFATGGHCPVIFITIAGQGHEWPGKPRVLPRFLTGEDNTRFDATGAIWDFFKDKSLDHAG